MEQWLATILSWFKHPTQCLVQIPSQWLIYYLILLSIDCCTLIFILNIFRMEALLIMFILLMPSLNIKFKMNFKYWLLEKIFLLLSLDKLKVRNQSITLNHILNSECQKINLCRLIISIKLQEHKILRRTVIPLDWQVQILIKSMIVQSTSRLHFSLVTNKQ